MPRRIKLIISLTFTLLFLAWIFQNINLTEILAVLRTANPIWLIPALIFFFFSVVLRAFRWEILLSSIKKISFNHIFSASMIGYLANNVLPFRMGEVVRAYALGEIAKITKISALSNIIIERLTDVSTMFIFLIAGAWFVDLPNWMQTMRATATIILIIAYSGLAVFYLFRKLFLKLLVQLNFPIIIYQAIGHFFNGLSSIRSLQNLVLIILLSLIAWLSEVLTYYFAGRSVGFSLSLFQMMIVLAVVNLGGAIPSSPGFVGNFEFFAVQSLLFFGIDKEVGLSFALLLHILLYFPVTLLGVLYVWKEKIDIRAKNIVIRR